jgi:gamma-glutamyltranspeptidase/glutathione hydrolase
VAVGSPGGATIITTVLQILVDRLDFGMTLPDAIAAPRASQRNTAKTDVEPAFLAQTDIVNALTARGHVFNTPAEIGAATGIEFLDDGDVLAAAEPVRRGGGSAMVVRPDAGGGGGGPGDDDDHGDEAGPGNDGPGGGHHTMHPLGARGGAR